MTLTEAAINVRASDIGGQLFYCKAKRAEFARDVLTPLPHGEGPVTKAHNDRALQLIDLIDDDPGNTLGPLLRLYTLEAIDAYARQRAEDEHNNLIPQLPDCNGCRETMAGEVVCCQEKL